MFRLAREETYWMETTEEMNIGIVVTMKAAQDAIRIRGF
jgi:hypothetical protein